MFAARASSAQRALVEERDDEEQLRAQHRCEFRLTRRALEELAAEQAHADRNTDGSKADHEAYCEQVHANYEVHL